MQSKEKHIVIPKYFNPYPYQTNLWKIIDSGKYDIVFALWSRQTGKDAFCIEHCLYGAWQNPGSQAAYIGLDNVWINNNIFKKTIDGRKFWHDYPKDLIEPKDTDKEVYMLNNPKDKAPARIKFIGFLNSNQIIGSSYDRFYISEGSLYKRHAFSYVHPIWDQKKARGEKLLVIINGTPRGIKNNLYDLLRTYTGEDEPEAFPGAHDNCYVDYLPITEAKIYDVNGKLRPMYEPEELEKVKDRYFRQFGNYNLFEQEMMCKFTTVNAGLVYQGIEQLMKEHRYTNFNLDTTKPIYLGIDIASKGKMTDATAIIIFQYINNMMFIYDIYEERGKALVEIISDLSQKDYFRYVRLAALPWDSERSASSETPIEEVRKQFPQITWHALDKERVDRGINLVRRQLSNMVINKPRCDFLIEAFNNYEYKWIESRQDWSPSPTHNRYSHIMDALRYSCMMLAEMEYLQLNNDGSDAKMPDTYEGFTSGILEY